MELTKELLLQIAANSRLKLSEEEVSEFLPQLKEVMEVFSKLEEVNTDHVEPAFHPITVRNVFREDKVEDCFSEEEVFDSAVKNKEEGYFKGPKAV